MRRTTQPGSDRVVGDDPVPLRAIYSVPPSVFPRLLSITAVIASNPVFRNCNHANQRRAIESRRLPFSRKNLGVLHTNLGVLHTRPASLLRISSTSDNRYSVKSKL